MTSEKLTELEAFKATKSYLIKIFSDLGIMPVAVVLGQLDWAIWTPQTPIDAAVLPDWQKAINAASLKKSFKKEEKTNQKISSEQAYRIMFYFLESFYESHPENEMSLVLDEIIKVPLSKKTQKRWDKAVSRALS